MNTRGFTLIEILATLAIMAILAMAVVPTVELFSIRNKEADLQRALREIRDALDAYKQASDEGRIAKTMDASGYPKTLQQLVDGVDDIKSPTPRRLYFLRRIPGDPFADPGRPANDSWGLRSYASPADAPAAGDDVYDIYSLSPRVGLNNVPYREW